MWKYILIIAAVIYSLFPLDLLPDYIFGWGWLDDIAILLILWQFYSRLKTRMAASGKKHEYSSKNSSHSQEGKPHGSTSSLKSPYEVLGISPNATADEIKKAYRHLANQYHPDKLAHLGDDFRLLAEKRFKEIQQAYQQLTGK